MRSFFGWHEERTSSIEAVTEGSATLKSKVSGAKKAKEKQENVTGFSEERKRKSKKADMGIAIEKLAGISEKEKKKSKKGKYKPPSARNNNIPPFFAFRAFWVATPKTIANQLRNGGFRGEL